MAWTDKPTESQLISILDWIKRAMPYSKAVAAVDYLRQNANRREVSDEMGRIRRLELNKNLDEQSCFNSSIWNGFVYKKPSFKEMMQEIREARELAKKRGEL